jgi:hypothetical protein
MQSTVSKPKQIFSIQKITLSNESRAYRLDEKQKGGWVALQIGNFEEIITTAKRLGATPENTTWPFCKKEISGEKTAISKIGRLMLEKN